MKFAALFCLSIVFGRSDVRMDPSEFPVPPYSKKSLFYIHRSPNPNTVIYDVNFTEKKTIDTKKPVKVYWIRYGEKGQYRELNYLERTFAYGVKPVSVDQLKVKMHFAVSKEKSFLVSLDETGQGWATMQINGRESKLTKIFVQVAEDGWWPKVAYVEFFGMDTETNNLTYEKMVIK